MVHTISNFVAGKPVCNHTGDVPVRVGPYEVRAAGTMYPDFLAWLVYARYVKNLVLVPLTDRGVPEELYAGCTVMPLYPMDFGSISVNWGELLEERIVPRLKAGDLLLAFCTASHGQTGTFLASLIALLESSEETPDPIAAVRERHCVKSVETLKQMEGIFVLRGRAVPEQYLHASNW